MNKFSKLRAKLAANSDAIALAGFYTALAGFFAAVIYVSVKCEQERQSILDEAIAAGKTVLPGPDGLTWIIDADKNVTAL